MAGRPGRNGLAGVAAGITLTCLMGCLAGCGTSSPGPVVVTAPTPVGAAATRCEALLSDAPAHVEGQGTRRVEPSGSAAMAWGDPPIVMTCGVERPAALSPTSQCFRVNGVDWFVSQRGRAVDPSGPFDGTLDFTTVGRAPYVSVSVPGSYQPAANPLVDLARTVRTHTAELHPCH